MGFRIRVSTSMTILFAGLILTTAGCSSTDIKQVLGKGVGQAAGAQVGYGANECFAVKSQCQQGHFESWETSDGTEGCSCKSL
ncbi:hypothetical protein OE749_02800 [Aestuariibacter sp. AA17]|uniref:Lipoprotein n=1 Tax=Fluctibacter corallii TaxID=2984329 RepID=A0ABT3A4N7_9ALTE|nr:hypothetical protein [Aestuariibacter sp. AA17]MCV2883628.1 hypothetical protein [Aestuariibacter sp. AA17]